MTQTPNRIAPLLWAAALLLASPGVAQAQAEATQVHAHSAAPGQQQATVLPSASGIVQVNIQTPSAAGVSRNTYAQFDVGPQGVILNNSGTDVLTQLGGYVQGNPWLAQGSARLILNEVVSEQPSHLGGFVEVAGPRADVVIANPSGITVNGGGFINAGGVTLSTGAPQWSGETLQGFDVRGGQIRLDGDGLDARTTDYLRLLTRSAQFNAGLWARKAEVITGANAVRLDASAGAAVEPLAAVGEPPPAGLALDVKALGGMYADTIRLVGTEAGLGVNNAGKIIASVGKLELSHAGWLRQAAGATMQATDSIHLNVDGHADVAGAVSATNDLRLHVGGDTQLRGATLGADHASVDARHLALQDSTVQARSIVLNAQSLDNARTQVRAREALTLAVTEALRNDALLHSAGQTLVSARTMHNGTGGAISGADTSVEVAQEFSNRGVVDAWRGHGVGQGRTSVQAESLHNAGGGRIYGDRVSLAADTLTNAGETVDGQQRAGTVASRGALDMGVRVLHNRPGASLLSLGDMRIGGALDRQGRATGRAEEVVNEGARIATDGALDLAATRLRNLNSNMQWRPVLGQSVDVEEYGVNGRYYSTLDGAVLLTPEVRYEPNYHYGDGKMFRYVGGPERGAFRVGTDPSPRTMTDLRRYRLERWVPQVVSSQPGVISSGRDMALRVADTLTNQQSLLVAGGTLETDTPRFINESLTATVDARKRGHVYRWQHHDFACRDQFFSGRSCQYDYNAYTPHDFEQTVPQTVVLQTSEVRSHQREPGDSTVLAVEAPPTLPFSGLYSFNYEPVQPEVPASRYLVQTDARFTDRNTWLSSDYMLRALDVDPAHAQKRLGDAFYERQLINEQVFALRGQRFLGDHRNDDAQYQALLQAGVEFARAHQLRPGVRLSAEQVRRLTGDIMWLETVSMTLPDGSTQEVLYPKLYAVGSERQAQPSGALVGAQRLDIRASETLTNQGSIQARGQARIEARDIAHTAGHIQASAVELKAARDIRIEGASVGADQALALQAGGDVVVQTTTAAIVGSQQGAMHHGGTVIDNTARLRLHNAAGTAHVEAQGKVELQGAEVDVAGDLRLRAGTDLVLGAVKVDEFTRIASANPSPLLPNADPEAALQAAHQNGPAHSSDYFERRASRDVATQIQVGGDLRASSQRFDATAAQVAAQGRVNVHAGTIGLRAGQDQARAHDVSTQSTTSSAGVITSTTTTRTESQHASSRAQPARITGKGGVEMVAADTFLSEGAAIDGGSASVVVGGRNRTVLLAAHDQAVSSTQEQTSTRLGVGGVDTGLGSKSRYGRQSSESQAVATRLSGDKVHVLVGNEAHLQGTHIVGDTRFVKQPGTSARLALGAAVDTSRSSEHRSAEQLNVWQSSSGHGTTDQTATLARVDGQVQIDEGIQTTVDVPRVVTLGGDQPSQRALDPAGHIRSVDQAQVQQQLDALSQQPGLGYLQQLAAPGNATAWRSVELAREHWHYDRQGLTPTGAALVSIAVAAYTGNLAVDLMGGAGATLGGSALTTTTVAGKITTTTLGAALNAGFSTLLTQTAVAMANNGGDIGKTLEQLGSEPGIKSLVSSMVTAGALHQLDAARFTVDGVSDQGLLRDLSHSVAGSAIDAAIQGQPLDEALLAKALRTALIQYGTRTGAHAIGDARVTGQLNAFTQQLAHAVLGCAGGAATAEGGAGCVPGALGAVVGEMAAQYYNPNAQPDQGQTLRFAKTMAAVAGVLAGTSADNAQAVGLAASAGANAAANNWLGDHQKALRDKEIARQTRLVDQLLIAARYEHIGHQQNVLTGAGIVAGLAEQGWDDVTGIVDFLKDPAAALSALTELLSDPDVRDQIGAQIVADLTARVDRMGLALREGGHAHAIQLGRDLGTTAWHVAGIATGAGAAGKAGSALARTGIRGAKVLEARAAADAAAQARARAVDTAISNKNLPAAGSVADPTRPVSATVPWKSATDLSPEEFNALVAERIPYRAEIVGTRDANVANAMTKADGLDPPFVPGTNIVEIMTTRPARFVRVYVKESGRSRQYGTWIMRVDDIQGLTPQQIASKYSLPQVPTMITDVVVPAGARLEVSAANNITPGASRGVQTGQNLGGGVQFQIKVPEGAELKKDWFFNERPL